MSKAIENSRRNIAATRKASTNTGSEPRVAKARSIGAKAEKPAASVSSGKKIGKPAAKPRPTRRRPRSRPRREEYEAAPAGEYAGKNVTVLVAPEDTGLSGNALSRWAIFGQGEEHGQGDRRDIPNTTAPRRW